MQPTQRTYTNILTGEVFRLHIDYYNKFSKLLSESNGEECKEYYASSVIEIELKDSKGKVYKLKQGEFLNTENIKLTHRKYFCDYRFKKIKLNGKITV